MINGVAGQGQLGQGRELKNQGWKLLEAVAGNAQQLQLLAVHQACGQATELVARQHQFLQARAPAYGLGQLLHAVVGENQPAQARRQAALGDLGNPAGLEAHHLQQGHLAQHGGQFGKRVVGRKQNAQLFKACQIGGQAAELVARQVENLQRVSQLKQRAGKFAQPVADANMAGADEVAGGELRMDL